MPGGGVLHDYSPNAQNLNYTAAAVDHLVGAAGLVSGDTAISYDKIHAPSAANSVFGGGSWTGVPGWLLNPPVGVPLFMVEGAGDSYMRGWLDIPAAAIIPTDVWVGSPIAVASQRYNGATGGVSGGFGMQLWGFVNQAGNFSMEYDRAPWYVPDNADNEIATTTATQAITVGKHQIVGSYEQATRLVSFYLDGVMFDQLQPTAGGLDFGAGLPGGQPFGHKQADPDGTHQPLACNLSGVTLGFGGMSLPTLGGSPVHHNYTPDVYDEIDFGNHTLSPTDVATAYAARGNFAAYTAAVLAQNPFGAYHLNEYPYTPPPTNGWHVGAIGWGS